MDERKEMSHWIFVINDTGKQFEDRMKKKEWPIFTFTANRKKINPDDKVLFYKAGLDGQKFLGHATVTSKLKKGDEKIDFFVSLKDIKIWKSPVSIHPLVDKLDFIWNKELWGHHMQGGVRKLSKKDFDLVVSKNKG